MTTLLAVALTPWFLTTVATWAAITAALIAWEALT